MITDNKIVVLYFTETEINNHISKNSPEICVQSCLLYLTVTFKIIPVTGFARGFILCINLYNINL